MIIITIIIVVTITIMITITIMTISPRGRPTLCAQPASHVSHAYTSVLRARARRHTQTHTDTHRHTQTERQRETDCELRLGRLLRRRFHVFPAEKYPQREKQQRCEQSRHAHAHRRARTYVCGRRCSPFGLTCARQGRARVRGDARRHGCAGARVRERAAWKGGGGAPGSAGGGGRRPWWSLGRGPSTEKAQTPDESAQGFGPGCAGLVSLGTRTKGPQRSSGRSKAWTALSVGFRRRERLARLHPSASLPQSPAEAPNAEDYYYSLLLLILLLVI